METVRALQRPIVVFSFIATIVGLTIFLVVRFGDAVMANDLLKFVIGGGLVILGFLFRDRVKLQK